MTDTTFVPGTPIVHDWLNDVNRYTYTTGPAILPGLALNTGAAAIGFTQTGTGAVTETVQDKLRQRISVKDFGAKGDNVTNDTAAIQAAIAANVGRCLWFPAGTYKVSNLTITGEVNFEGEGYSLSQITQITGSTGDVVKIIGVRHPSMRHIAIGGCPTGRDCLNISGSSSGTQFIDCFFFSAGRDGANVNGTTDNAVFIDCIAESNGRDGIAFESATSNGTVAFGRFAAGTRYSIRAEGNTLGPGHRFISNTSAFGQTGYALINQNYTTIDSCESIQCSQAAVVLQGAQYCSVTNTKLHSNSNHAVQTSTGNLLVLDSPVYVGTGNGTISVLAIIDRSVAVAETWTLTAISPTVFTVSGSVSGAQTGNNATVGVPWTNTALALLITAGGVAFVAGGVFTFHTSNGTQSAQYNSISNCGITLNGGNGILLGSGSNLNNITSNAITLNAIEGILCSSAGDNNISNNIIGGNGLTGSPKYGINITDGGSGASSNNRILGNSITDLGIAGAQTTGIVNAATASFTLIENNKITATTPITVSGGTATIRNNQGYITEANGSGTIASGNTSVTLSHTLSFTPTQFGFTVMPVILSNTDPGEIYIDTITSTQFTVRCRTNPGATGLAFYWKYSQ